MTQLHLHSHQATELNQEGVEQGIFGRAGFT